MCGIAGIYRFGALPPAAGEQAADRATVSRMLECLEHRGPDDAGLESIGRVTLGVRRLSILDIQGGHQPLSDASGRVWAMQNGEIYNFPELRADLARRHELRTRSDTELLPHLWIEHRERTPERLRGMFAIAVYDTRDETLLLARDPVGVKPLYVARVGDRLLFASELRALLTDPTLPRDWDHDALGRYFALGFVPGSATVFRAIRKMRPGVRRLLTPQGDREERYWPWPRFLEGAGGAGAPASLDAMADEIGSRLADSTRAMLLSDRPVGLLLSGGVDSSLLVALLPEEVRRETRTFAIGFEDSGHHDERPHARAVAEQFGTRHHESVVRLDVAAELPRIAAMMDEPLADPAAVPAHLVARAAAEHVTVLLSGTGGDELFGGYRRYRLPALLRRVGWMPPALAGAVAAALGNRDQHRRTLFGEQLVMARKLFEARARGPFLPSYLSTFEPCAPRRWRGVLSDAVQPAVAVEAMAAELVAETAHDPGSAEAWAFAADHLWYLPDDLLLKEDRATMGASVEGRVPYLDDALVRYAATLPLDARIRGAEGKVVLRHLARRHLPPAITDRRKHGFSVPIEDLLRGPLDSLLGDVLSGTGSGWLDARMLRGWHDEHRRQRDRSGPLWAALAFELWWREVGSATPERLVAGGRPLRGVRSVRTAPSA